MEQITGKFVKVLEQTSGVRKSDGASWEKKVILLDIGGTKPTFLHIGLFNTNCNIAMKEGDMVTMNISTTSREYNNKWYYDVFASNITVVQGNSVTNSNQQSQGQRQPRFNSAQEVKQNAISNGNTLVNDPDDLPW